MSAFEPKDFLGVWRTVRSDASGNPLYETRITVREANGRELSGEIGTGSPRGKMQGRLLEEGIWIGSFSETPEAEMVGKFMISIRASVESELIGCWDTDDGSYGLWYGRRIV